MPSSGLCESCNPSEKDVTYLDIRNTMERLCSQCAPSGFEQPAAETAAELLRPFVDEVSIDRMGNVVGVRRCGKENAPRLLLDAHLDEIGLIVTGVEDGFLHMMITREEYLKQCKHAD